MNKKLILFSVVIIVIYIAIYWVTLRVVPISSKTKDTLVDIPKCEEKELTIGILESGSTVCLSDKNILTRINNKPVSLYTFNDNEMPTYAGMVGNYLILEKSQKLQLLKVTAPANSLDEVASIAVQPNESIITHYAYDTSSSVNIIVTAMKTVNSTTQEKTQIYRVIIDKTNHTVQVEKRELHDMEKVVYATPTNIPVIVTTEMFPFLEKKVRVYQWEKILKQTTPPCSDINIFAQNANGIILDVNSCKNFKEGFYGLGSSNGNLVEMADVDANCLYKSAELSLCFNANGVLVNATTHANIVLPLNREQYTAITYQYSTRINKNVYNCNDFGESPQITLRVCIPEL